jgi:hypothetical protein
MPKYYFKVVDTIIVIDCGAYDLPDATAAQIESIELAIPARKSRRPLATTLFRFRH